VTSADLSSPTTPSTFLVEIMFGDAIRYWSERATRPDDDDDDEPSTHRPVRAVRHVGDHVVVAGEDRATLHAISRYRAKQQIIQVDTDPKSLGVCALAQVEGRRAYPVRLAYQPPANSTFLSE
jgi:hypothetical protein